MQIILASNSPRRRELLKLLEIPFEVKSPKFSEETQSHLSPEAEAVFFAEEKATSLREEYSNALIIGSDTIVELQGKKLGKPKDEKDALEMLMELAGKTHRVLTGVAVWDPTPKELRDCLAQTRVTMKNYSQAQAKKYVATGEPLGKAGAYAIQGEGGQLVESILGDYFNVVGLPLRDLAEILKKIGIKIEVDLEKIYLKKAAGFS